MEMVSTAKYLPRLLLAVLLAAAVSAAGARAAALGEYEVKAAFLYNFAKFIDWPDGAVSAELTLCVLGVDPFGPALDALAGKEVHGRRLVARRLESNADAAECHIVFVAASESQQLEQLLSRFSAHTGQLLVSDIPGFARRGGSIELLLDQNRVRFAVNIDAATRAGLVVSSKLLRLAEETGGS